MNALAIRLSVSLLAIASVQCAEARAQLRTAPAARVPQEGLQPSRPPGVLYQQLMSPDPNSQFSATEQRIDALRVLGIGGSEFQELRLTYQDLDGDRIPEALFTIQLDNSNNVTLVVLKQRGNQWYRLASPPEFSCWCKYEGSPLDTFAEIRPWPYGKNAPAKLLFVRESGGGTGIYDRELFAYALQGFDLKQVFHVTEERRACPWFGDPIKCNVNHAEVVPADSSGQPAALLVLSYERMNVGSLSDTWWIGLPIQTCQAHTWNVQREQFLEDRTATSAYCSHLGR